MQTALYQIHHSLGAKIVDFQGWEMPIQYKGIVQEHLAVRNNVGIFDVSHMGRVVVEGPDAENLLDYLSTNTIKGKSEGSATYTVWCDEDGMSVDDLIVYRFSSTKYFVIVNAGNKSKDLAHLKKHAKGKNVVITDRYQEEGILALQGPKAAALLSKLFPKVSSIPHMHFINVEYQGVEIIISNTGYTGAGGVEIYAPTAAIKEIWQWVMEAGKKYGIEPIGLGARDTLRLEMGYALYGHELNDKIAPIESVSAWTVRMRGRDFLGKSALVKLQGSPKRRHAYGIVLVDKGIAREGYEVFKEGKQIGKVTSGTFSPSLNQAIAIVLVDKNLLEGDSVEVQIRQNFCQAKVVNLPFYKNS